MLVNQSVAECGRSTLKVGKSFVSGAVAADRATHAYSHRPAMWCRSSPGNDVVATQVRRFAAVKGGRHRHALAR
jgi:hypothetical protein